MWAIPERRQKTWRAIRCGLDPTSHIAAIFRAKRSPNREYPHGLKQPPDGQAHEHYYHGRGEKVHAGADFLSGALSVFPAVQPPAEQAVQSCSSTMLSPSSLLTLQVVLTGEQNIVVL